MKLSKFTPIYLLTIVNTFSFSLLIPVLPYLLESYSVGSFFYWIILSLFSLFQFFATPLLGSLSDRYGRRKILLITQFWTFVSRIIFALALFIDPAIAFLWIPVAIWTILAARIVDGITGWNQSVANAYIADLTPDGDKTQWFGVIGMLIGIWIVIWPAVGWVSVHLWGNFFWPILVALWFSSFVFLVILFNLRESLNKEDREIRPLNERLSDFFPRQKVREFLHFKNIPLLLLIVLCFGFVFHWFTTAYVWYTIKTFNLTLIEASGYMIMLWVFFAFNQWFLLRKLTKYFSDTILLFIWFVFLTFGLGIFVYDLWFRWFVITTYFASIWVSFVLSITKSLLTQATPSSRHGAIIGIEESIHSCMRVIAPIIAWFLWWFVGEFTFWFFGIFSFLWLLLAYHLLTQKT